ncbi:glycosyl hydrolase [Dactylonectria macrodidyma]|uniref:Glycosyl hydrolase n=1 Tax=Dactylonectria macrodidyma TaxID=307937 RepID=A0A9P9DZZ4_9HYPO|nr:glycosyl hydrolase [Dactylonectria macrodidyma]
MSMEKGPDFFTNPVIWEDLADLEVIRVHDTYYYSASTMAFSPGAPVLRSYDLVNWEYIGHSVPKLPFGPEYYLDGRHSGAYVKGIWASTFGYRPSNDMFYWYGSIQGTGKTYIYTAKCPEGPWTAQNPMDKLYYDAGLLIDDGDTMYLAYGSKTIFVAQLSRDGLHEVRDLSVYTAPDVVEGARMYKIYGAYYIWITKPGDEQLVLKSVAGPFGPYECRQVISAMPSPIPGSAPPHQGALVDTPDGKWYYMAFIDAYPGGRLPVLAPVKFDSDGWPHIISDTTNTNVTWGLDYPMPVVSSRLVYPVGPYKDTFAGASNLNHRWEWNHNPVNDKWSIEPDGLMLQTASVTQGIYFAANTLTHRILGPKSQGTFRLDVSNLTDGDRTGAVLFRDQSAYIGIHKEGTTTKIVYVGGISMNAEWGVVSNGAVEDEGAGISADECRDIWLRIKADIAPAFYGSWKKKTRYAIFEYSTDGHTFHQLGPKYALLNTWEWYIGYRFGVFNFATKQLGGSVLIKSFQLSRWN